VQVHLDRVEGLGSFLEFELETESDLRAMSKARDTVSWLQNRLGISAEDLVRSSYSDL
jgi:adenylate cyclase class IV